MSEGDLHIGDVGTVDGNRFDRPAVGQSFDTQRERLGEIVQLEDRSRSARQNGAAAPGCGGDDTSPSGIAPATPVSATNLPFIVAGLPVTIVLADTSSVTTVSGALPVSVGPSPRSDALSV